MHYVLVHHVSCAVERDDFVAALHQALRHVAAHASETDHRQPHGSGSWKLEIQKSFQIRAKLLCRLKENRVHAE